MRRDVFQAIADPTRRQIINFIASKSMTVNTVADSFDISRQAISNHLKILMECGIVAVNQQGRERYCYVQAQKLDEVTDWIESFRKSWDYKFDKLDNILAEMQAKPKTKKK